VYLAVDIGGTKTLLGVFTKNGQLKEQFRFETPTSYATFLSVLRRHIEPLMLQDITAIGVAAPGMIDRSRGVGKNFGNLKWKNAPLQKDLELMTHTPVAVENDANLAGLSEARNLKGDFNKVLFITISTGIGTGIITNGVIDPEFADSEGGFLQLEYKGKLTPWEDFASGSAILERYGKQARDIKDKKIWKTICHDWARGMLGLIAVVQPDAIVIGGGVGSHFDRFGDILTKELKKYETPMTPIPPLFQAKRPEEAVIYGCYELLKDMTDAKTSR